MEEYGFAVSAEHTAQVVLVAVGNLLYYGALLCIYEIDTVMSAAHFREAKGLAVVTPREVLNVSPKSALNARTTF